jgi:hypothetical protein
MTCKILVNGEPSGACVEVEEGDELAFEGFETLVLIPRSDAEELHSVLLEGAEYMKKQEDEILILKTTLEAVRRVL